MKARTALLELFRKSSEWRAFFRSCCETSAFRLRSQAWQFCEELNDRGHKLRVDEVEDSLLGLARELLPNTPAAHWDAEGAHEVCKDASLSWRSATLRYRPPKRRCWIYLCKR